MRTDSRPPLDYATDYVRGAIQRCGTKPSPAAGPALTDRYARRLHRGLAVDLAALLREAVRDGTLPPGEVRSDSAFYGSVRDVSLSASSASEAAGLTVGFKVVCSTHGSPSARSILGAVQDVGELKARFPMSVVHLVVARPLPDGFRYTYWLDVEGHGEDEHDEDWPDEDWTDEDRPTDLIRLLHACSAPRPGAEGPDAVSLLYYEPPRNGHSAFYCQYLMDHGEDHSARGMVSKMASQYQSKMGMTEPLSRLASRRAQLA